MTNQNTARTCGRCRWFDAENQVTPQIPMQLPGQPIPEEKPKPPFWMGKCRHKSPRIFEVINSRLHGGWPPTSEDQWCGEWEKKK